MSSRFRFAWLLVSAALFTNRSLAAEQAAGDAEAKKLTRTAMDKNYRSKNYAEAVKKLGQAATNCEQKGCTPAVHAQVYACLAVVHWNGTEDYDSAIEALRTMVRIDPDHAIEKRFASAELRSALDTAKTDVDAEKNKGATSPAPAAAASAAPPPQREEAPPEEDVDPAEAKEREFRRQVEARKAQYAREAELARKKGDEEAARFAAEQKKAEEARKIEEARKAVEDKKEAERKAVEDKKEEARRAAEAKAAEAARKVEEAKRLAQEKKDAARKAAEDKKAEDARKAEEARKAKEEERLRTPIRAGQLQEQTWPNQTIGYPLPVYVKLPPPPAGVEKERTTVVRVVTEYSSPSTPVPQRFELKPLGNGAYGGLLPCDATSQEGLLTYFTIALNKYDNLVAIGASPQKPNKVKVLASMSGQFPHLPGSLPPSACAAEASSAPVVAAAAGQAAAPTTPCASDKDCPDGGICAQKACAVAKPAPPVPTTKHRRGCVGCRLGARDESPPWWGIALVLTLGAARLLPAGRRAGWSA